MSAIPHGWVALDLETTGLLDPDHRICEIYMSRHAPDGAVLAEFHTLVNPGRSIPPEATRVHGINGAAVADAPRFADVASDVLAFLEGAPFLVAHNGEEFDGPFLGMEFARVGRRATLPPVFDTMKRGRWATCDGRIPNLGALCFAVEVDYDTARAHAASYDVQVMAEAFVRGVRWGAFDLREFVDAV